MPNQRAAHIKRATITVDRKLYEWAKATAEKTGINDFSTYIRTLIAAEIEEEKKQNQKLKPKPKPKKKAQQ